MGSERSTDARIARLERGNAELCSEIAALRELLEEAVSVDDARRAVARVRAVMAAHLEVCPVATKGDLADLNRSEERPPEHEGPHAR